jgi:hypothetical protein
MELALCLRSGAYIDEVVSRFLDNMLTPANLVPMCCSYTNKYKQSLSCAYRIVKVCMKHNHYSFVQNCEAKCLC